MRGSGKSEETGDEEQSREKIKNKEPAGEVRPEENERAGRAG